MRGREQSNNDRVVCLPATANTDGAGIERTTAQLQVLSLGAVNHAATPFIRRAAQPRVVRRAFSQPAAKQLSCDRRPIGGPRRPAVWSRILALIACAAVLASPAVADEAIRYALNIQSQPLGTALQEFAKQSGVQIIFVSRVAEARDAPALHGTYTQESALGALLEGSGLTFHQINPKTVEVQAKASIRDSAESGSVPPLSGTLSTVADKTAANDDSRLWAEPRLAQADARTSSKAATVGAPQSPSSASRTGRDGTPESHNLDEIVVTATRHETSVGKVPLSITALSQQKLDVQGIKGIDRDSSSIPLMPCTSSICWLSAVMLSGTLPTDVS